MAESMLLELLDSKYFTVKRSIDPHHKCPSQPVPAPSLCALFDAQMMRGQTEGSIWPP